nr:hypothetical protein GCM10020093_027580 [Planobispora longispora]
MSATARRTAAALAGRRAWLCDLDGTLVDSAPAHEAAFRAALAEISPEALGSFDYGAHMGASTRQVVEDLGVPRPSSSGWPGANSTCTARTSGTGPWRSCPARTGC